jgi:YbgC/YbaW family acyl-CoA thioester hydrolase
MRKSNPHKYFTSVHYKDLDMYSVVYHPNYLVLVDDARNRAFADYGYPIEDQLSDKVGFTVAGITNLSFKRPLFMGESIDIYTELISTSNRSCEVLHTIRLSNSSEADPDVFSANFQLVFVSISDIEQFPLNSSNIKKMKVIPFNDRAKTALGI